ncbi:hypothetical protein MMC17_002384 [Xylographa soralifera]|nr:hypothetical protein [Xylographa soralifera]
MALKPNSPKDVAVDVLIVGAGPAGFMAAVTLARYGVEFRLIDQRAERIQTGHAGGVQPRTLEVLQTLDLQYALDCHGNHVCEAAFWGIDAAGKLGRTHVGPEVVHATPYPYILAVPQQETEKALDLDLNARGYVVDRPTQLLHFEYTDDAQYPIHALVKNKFSNATSFYRCKYLVGSDGAGSVTCRVLDIPVQSSSHDDVWVVADMEFESDFPDVRRRSIIRSQYGAIMLIPNAGGGNRVYTQLSPKELADLKAIDDSQSMKLGKRLMATEWKDLALFNILKTRLKDNLKPYTGNIKKILWISQYRVKQGLLEDFSDHNRVFVVGDACHTHSPKAAQGLNISMMDSYNLTWKLALVLQGKMRPEILETYNAERRQIAQELIEFDTNYSHVFGKKEFLDNNAEFHEIYEKAHGFTTGIGLHYLPNQLISPSTKSPINIASLDPLTPGKRFPPFPAIRHIDGTPVAILSEMPSFGRFHLFIFAGTALRSARFEPCAAYLGSPSSVLTRYSPSAAHAWAPENIRHGKPTNPSRVIDLFLLHTASHYAVELAALPAPLPDWKHRVYADKQGKTHEDNGVDPDVGAMVLVRPDGYVALVTGLEGGAQVTEFMDSSMVVPMPDASNGV